VVWEGRGRESSPYPDWKHDKRRITVSIQFIWEDSYSVGREDIDKQHKHIFVIASSLSDTIEVTRGNRIIMALYKHIREHFTAEEQMMKDIGYPKLEEHRNLHDNFITELNRIAEAKGSSTDKEPFGELKTFLYHWVIDHILNHDMDYVRFIH
jgi:hemerythrin